MNFEDFCEEVKRGVAAGLDMDPDKIEVRDVEKMGASYTGLVVHDRAPGETTEVDPVFNLSSLYPKYQEKGSVNEVINYLVGTYADAKQNGLSLSKMVQDIATNYEEAKKYLVLRPVNEKNAVKNAPTITVAADIKMGFMLNLEGLGEGRAASINITDDMMKRYGVTKEQMLADALANQSPKMISIEAQLQQLMFGMEEVMESEVVLANSPMNVVTSADGIHHGAAILANNEYLKKVGKMYGQDYYVLPSSVHEVLFVKQNTAPTEEQLIQMVKEVNRNEVQPEDFLSDTPFRYDRAKERLIPLIPDERKDRVRKQDDYGDR